MITIEPEAAAELQQYQGILRLQLRSSGCCEPALAAFWDERRAGDLCTWLNSLCIVVDPDTFGITGPITVARGPSGGPPSLMLTTAKPLSEWAGLTATVIDSGPG